MNINARIDVLKGKSCWSIVAGEGTGSVVTIGFGDKRKKSKPLKNPNLTEEQRNFDSEIEIMVYCAWRVLSSDSIICSWRDSNELDGEMLKGLQLLKDKKVIEAKLMETTYDLDIIFENGIRFQLFCDQTNDYDSDENFTIFMGHESCTVGLKSALESN